MLNTANIQIIAYAKAFNLLMKRCNKQTAL